MEECEVGNAGKNSKKKNQDFCLTLPPPQNQGKSTVRPGSRAVGTGLRRIRKTSRPVLEPLGSLVTLELRLLGTVQTPKRVFDAPRPCPEKVRPKVDIHPRVT